MEEQSIVNYRMSFTWRRLAFVLRIFTGLLGSLAIRASTTLLKHRLDLWIGLSFVFQIYGDELVLHTRVEIFV